MFLMCKCYFLNVYNLTLIKFIRITCFFNFQRFFSFANAIINLQSFLVEKLNINWWIDNINCSFLYIQGVPRDFSHRKVDGIKINIKVFYRDFRNNNRDINVCNCTNENAPIERSGRSKYIAHWRREELFFMFSHYFQYYYFYYTKK